MIQTIDKLDQIHIGKRGAARIAAPGWTAKYGHVHGRCLACPRQVRGKRNSFGFLSVYSTNSVYSVASV